MAGNDDTRPITIAIMGIGGQGGGVLADWIVELAGANGYLAQYTSVPGVAQRTGATVYYLELFPESAAQKAGRPPVMALMPASGSVDIVVASELMEAGRAMLRGFVTPDRTALIASSHRVFGILEKSAMGDGRANPDKVLARARERSKTLVSFDMDDLARSAGAPISAVLFGALAGSGVLPFARAAFETAIRHGAKAVDANIAAFAAGFDGCSQQQAAPGKQATPAMRATTPGGEKLVARIRAEVSEPVQALALEGVKRLADYQDHAYAGEYLDRLGEITELDRRVGGAARAFRLSELFARHLALWMSYEDVIRVADLKTRKSRFDRVREEVRADAEQLVYITEFMHPRYRELCEVMPAGLGARLLTSQTMQRLTAPLFRRGRRVSTAKLGGFALLCALAGLRRFRRSTLRHRVENDRIASWTKRVVQAATRDYDLAVELVACQRLVKGYSDTHERGVANFERIMALVDRRPDKVSAADVQALREAALADEKGEKLSVALQRHAQ